MKNESLAKLDVLGGEWGMTMTDAGFLDSPDVEVHGDSTVEWLGEACIGQ